MNHCTKIGIANEVRCACTLSWWYSGSIDALQNLVRLSVRSQAIARRSATTSHNPALVFTRFHLLINALPRLFASLEVAAGSQIKNLNLKTFVDVPKLTFLLQRTDRLFDTHLIIDDHAPSLQEHYSIHSSRLLRPPQNAG